MLEFGGGMVAEFVVRVICWTGLFSNSERYCAYTDAWKRLKEAGCEVCNDVYPRGQ